MTDRRYYSERAGRGPAAARLNIDDLKRIFGPMFTSLEAEGYFQEQFGYECVDSGFVAGNIGNDIQAELALALRKPHLWPIQSTIGKWEEDDLFDMIEFLFDNVSKPTRRHYHDYSNCGWHCLEFDRCEGQDEFRQKVNRLLKAYDSGFELSEGGEVLAFAPTGFDRLLEAELPVEDEENISARVDAAIHKFRRHRASIEDRRDAVRDLADVLEYLRPKLKTILLSKDEQDLFNIANNFGIRHHNAEQRSGYDKNIWLSWVFYYYLATIHASVRLVKRDSGAA